MLRNGFQLALLRDIIDDFNLEAESIGIVRGVIAEILGKIYDSFDEWLHERYKQYVSSDSQQPHEIFESQCAELRDELLYAFPVLTKQHANNILQMRRGQNTSFEPEDYTQYFNVLKNDLEQGKFDFQDGINTFRNRYTSQIDQAA